MKANAVSRLLSSLVWIDSGIVVSQHQLGSFLHEIKCNGITSFMEFMHHGLIEFSSICRYLTSSDDYYYEENTTRADLPVTCYFIRRKQEVTRPISVDLGLPEPRGMFRTPNPSPAPSPVTSNCPSPCDHLTPSTSPPKLNSPENTLPKFKVITGQPSLAKGRGQ